MSIQEQKITEAAIAANGVQSRPDKLTGTAAQNKKVFDALVTAVVREKFNALLDELTGTSAAAQLGITTIPGFSADNIQTALEQIVQAMQDVTQGSVADGSITLLKLAAEVTAVAIGGAAAIHTHGAGDIDSGTLKDYVNDVLIPFLEGTSAAESLGITTIPGFSADNIQTALEQIVQAMQEITQGSVADGSITLAKLAAEVTAVALGGAAASHTHGAGDINSGVLNADRIPVLDGTKLGTGSVGTAQLGAAAVTAEKLAALAVPAQHIANGAVTTQKLASGAVTAEKIADGVVTREKLADSARGNASLELSSTPFSAENNGRLLIFSSSENTSYTLTQSLWNSLPSGFSVTIVKANGADSGALTINWTSMAGVWDFTRGTVYYNETSSLNLVRRGDMVTFEKWGETNRLLISGNFNTPNFYKGTSATPPTDWQPGDIYLHYK